jgi:hypothetical protein
MLKDQVCASIDRIRPGCRVLVLYGDQIIDPFAKESYRSSRKKSQEKELIEEVEQGDF